MIKRSVQEANQRVAARRILEVARQPAELAAAIQELLDKWNTAADAAFEASLATKGKFGRWAAANNGTPQKRHYFLLARSDQLWITYGIRATWVAERGFSAASQGWLAEIVPGKPGPGNAMSLAILLGKFSVNDKGYIWNGGRYVQLLDGLVAGLGGRYVSAPVDESDCRFVSYA